MVLQESAFVLPSKERLHHSLSHTSMEWPAPMELNELFMVESLCGGALDGRGLWSVEG